jgi:hypothetical protein
MHWMGQAGLGLGQSFFAAQMLMAVLVLPAAVWAGISRMGTGAAALFAAVCVIFCVALVHGEAQTAPSISMHYNRWGWAVAFCALLVAVVPPRHRRSQGADGLVIGLAMAFLALSKVTYFVAFAPAVALALVLRRDWLTIGVAMAAGLGAALAVTLWQGVAFWPAYLGDLMAVSASDVRPKPGDSLAVVIASPAGIGASLVLLASVIALRQSGRRAEGLALLVLVPGFFYVTYQNFGNDPQWIVFLPFLLWALRPAEGLRNPLGWDMRAVTGGLCVASVALASTSFLNMAYSPFRHLKLPVAGTTPLAPGHTDLRQPALRAYAVIAEVPLSVEGRGFARYAARAEMEPPAILLGEALPQCRQKLGLKAFFEAAAQDLEGAGYGGSGIFFADIFNSIWLYGDFRPLKGGAPWYYGGLAGWEDADYLAVPLCSGAGRIRRAVLAELEAQGETLREVWRGDVLVLLERAGPSAAGGAADQVAAAIAR